MGKKVKKKARSSHKDKRVAATFPNTVPEDQNPTDEQVNDVASVAKERSGCAHLVKPMDLTRVSSKIELAEVFRCEDCREGGVDRKAAKGKGKHGKMKGPDSKAIWLCLECGHFACGGVGLPTTHQSHAVRHARQTRHPLIIQAENPHLRWCFPCSVLIPLDRLEENGELKDVLSDLVKLIKKQPSGGASLDVEDVWFNSGGVVSEIKSENSSITDIHGRDFYAVRGLNNLGNTCFFNSVLQNLLAMDRLQEDLLKLDYFSGPLTSSLKKLFVEINAETGMSNVLNPKSLFGSVCSKAPQFRGYQQQDSHELLRYLLDGLSAEDLCTKKLNNSSLEHEKSSHVSSSFVDAIFGGQLSSTVCCVECGCSSVVYEPFLDLSLPVPTRKSSPKKVQAVSRTRKTKPPPRRIGKTRPKHGKDRISAPILGDPRPPTESSHGLQPSVVTAEGSGDSLSGSSLVCSTNSGAVLDSGSHSQNCGVSASPESKSIKGFPNAAQKAASLDDSTWMDFLEPISLADDKDSTSQCEEQDSVRTGMNQDGAIHKDVGTCSNQVVLHNGKDFPDAAQQGVSLDDSTWTDFLEPMSLAEKQDFPSQCDELSASQYSGRIDTMQNEANDEGVDTCSDEVPLQHSDLNVKSDSFGYSFEDEVPLQVGDSEILLLPYKEETVATGDFVERDIEPSSSAVGDGEDFLGFDGFADMFNEPEVRIGPSVKPSTGAGEDMENGFLAGNSSESNPDEVDDTDSPVSIESCLSHFTKPECLADEHAWHCENCTKIMLEEKRKSRKNKLKSVSAIQNGCDDNLSSFEVGQTNGNNGTADSNGEQQKMDMKQIRRSGEEKNHRLANALSDASETSHSFQDSDRAALTNNNASNFSEESIKLVADQTSKKASEIIEDCESGESDEEETDSKSVKAMRDATKRILISKLPPILTIHLKRFSQDARGRLNKLNGHVLFKEVIDLRSYMDSRCPESQGEYKYRLVGLVVHSGNMRGGHYVAYVRGGDRRKGEEEEGRGNRRSVWYYASDALVHETNLEEVLKCEAYILFYEKV